MAANIKLNNGHDYGLLPDVTKPLPIPMLIFHQGFLCGIHLTAITLRVLKLLFYYSFLNIKRLNLLTHLAGANEMIKAFAIIIRWSVKCQ